MPKLLITAQNASAYGRKGRAIQLANGVRKPGYHPPPSANQTEIQDARAREVLELIRAQLRETDAVLRDKTYCYCETCKRGGIDGKTRAQLLGALDRLLERERVWSQRPGPANIKVGQQTKQRPQWIQPAYPTQAPPSGNLSDSSIPTVVPQQDTPIP